MGGAGDNGIGVVRQDMGIEVGVRRIGAEAGDDEVEGAVAQPLDQRFVAAADDVDAHTGSGLAERSQRPDQQRAAGAGGAADRNAPLLGPLQAGEIGAGVAFFGGHCLGVARQGGAEDRGCDPARAAIDQPHPQFGLEAGQAFGQRRCRQVQGVRGPPEIAVLDGGKELPQLAQIHVLSIS